MLIKNVKSKKTGKKDIIKIDNDINVNMHIRGADFLKARKLDQELEKVISKKNLEQAYSLVSEVDLNRYTNTIDITPISVLDTSY